MRSTKPAAKVKVRPKPRPFALICTSNLNPEPIESHCRTPAEAEAEYHRLKRLHGKFAVIQIFNREGRGITLHRLEVLAASEAAGAAGAPQGDGVIPPT